MGELLLTKYKFLDKIANTTEFKSEMLNAIANELAEANRLTRYNMKLGFLNATTKDGIERLEENLKEVEDKA